MSTLPKPYDLRRSWSYALWLLSRKSYTGAEIRDKLLRKQAPAEVIQAVITKLEQYRYLDDQRYTESYVQSRKHKKGRLQIKQELRRKGISDHLMEQELEALDTETELQAASNLLRKNQWRFQTDDANKNHVKAYRYLAQRGFSVEIVQEALTQLKRQVDTDAQDK